MRPGNSLHEKIDAFHRKVELDPHHRYRSWEHCYHFFRSRPQEVIASDKNLAALHLGFYLASFGMYRGSAFLLQRTYTVHERIVERLTSSEFTELWDHEVGSNRSDTRLTPLILDAVAAVKTAYDQFGPATDILATKVLLGTFGCLPASDRFFVDGFKKCGGHYSRVNRQFVDRVLEFCFDRGAELRAEQSRIQDAGGIRYPLMKLVDMYFWQIGYEAAARKPGGEQNLRE